MPDPLFTLFVGLVGALLFVVGRAWQRWPPTLIPCEGCGRRATVIAEAGDIWHDFCEECWEEVRL